MDIKSYLYTIRLVATIKALAELIIELTKKNKHKEASDALKEIKKIVDKAIPGF